MKLLLFACLLISCFTSKSQSADFFVMKRSGKTVRSFYKDRHISFITKDGENYSGYIKKVAKDSVWIQYQQVWRGFTSLGSVLLDTVMYEARRFAVKDIKYILKEKQRFEQISLTGLMKLGAAGYSLLHIVNSLILQQEINFVNIGIAAGVYLAGVLINKLHKDYYSIGKKYRLQYVSLSVNQQ